MIQDHLTDTHIPGAKGLVYQQLLSAVIALVITKGEFLKLKMSVLTYFGPVWSSFMTRTNKTLNMQLFIFGVVLAETMSTIGKEGTGLD